ncbi:MAG: hypothetical protein M1549_00810 [Candidatus Dependentiae bacterium]|nr:hypothetical protein [Candidatus Dependentiae bacterium]
MKHRLRVARYLLLGLTAVAAPSRAREIIKEYALFCTEERVNGQLFSRHVEVVNGAKVVSLRIDEQQVTADGFEEQLLRAEAEERRAQLRAELELTGSREQELQQTRSLAVKKLLGGQVARCKRDLALLEKFALDRYLAFSPETLTRQTYEHVVTKLIPAAEQAAGVADIPLEQAETLYRELGEHERGLTAFVFATIRQAIDQCTDPKLLKELLETISS